MQGASHAQGTIAHLPSRRRYRYAVGFGVALSCARFAWQSASHIAVRHYFRAARRGEAGGQVKVYEVDGPLFFASAMPFIKQARAASPSRDPSSSHAAIPFHHVTHITPSVHPTADGGGRPGDG